MRPISRQEIGPSPRVWGLRCRGPRPGFPIRAIPTCVGTTMSPGRPRLTFSGPSPRVWGLLGHLVARGVVKRAIPTCVGTTPRRGRPGSPPLGYPHVCGDYEVDTGRWDPALGPSPRAWGLPGPNAHPRDRPRAIPTCVGTTRISSPRDVPREGHPHVRGDYGPRGPPRQRAGAGHPHVRGDYGSR